MRFGLKSGVGRVSWIDITIKDASRMRDFYKGVVGWNTTEVDMGGYSDYNMNGEDGKPIVGICHARGVNVNLPPQWLIYITVENLDKSLDRCKELGGRIVDGPRNMGENSRFCVIQDPSGAVAALWEHASQDSKDDKG